MSSGRVLRSRSISGVCIPGSPSKRPAHQPTEAKTRRSHSRDDEMNNKVNQKRELENSENTDNASPIKKARLRTPEFRITPNQTIVAAAEIDRPAEPHRTNAPLVTPQGSRYVAYPREALDMTLKAGLPRPSTTTGQLLEQACAHLIRMDRKLQPLIEKHYCRPFCAEGLAEECDPFKSLCSSIMAQQVSGAAASSIKRKFVSLFHKPTAQVAENLWPFPTPKQVVACDIPFLRQAGLSERKAEYIKGLAEKFVSGELSASMLINASDEEVLEKLTAVRGLGKWSVEMFACFGLKRLDILSTGDLGVQYDDLSPCWRLR